VASSTPSGSAASTSGATRVVVSDYRDKSLSRVFDKTFKSNGVTSTLLRGRLWVDAATAQLRQDRWEVFGDVPRVKSRCFSSAGRARTRRGRYGISRARAHRLRIPRARQGEREPGAALLHDPAHNVHLRRLRRFDVATEESIGTPVSPR
jgi:hypothetical protein